MMKLQSASKLHRRVATLRPVVLALISAGCVSAALAGPLPENVTRKAGDADVLTNGNTMTITQRSSRAAFESTNFSIDVGNTVAVNGPAGSLTLMRVIGNGSGGQSSQINGSLFAQNTFMLINPFGIYVGGKAMLQAANLVLSAKDLSPDLVGQDGSYAGFMSNAHLVFNTNATNSYGNPIGDSTIDIGRDVTLKATGVGGSIYLIADNVRNRGTILAANAGKVGLLAVPSAEFDVEANVGDSGFITLTNYANFNYGLSQQEQDYTYRSAVNTGTIDAPNGDVTLVGVGNTGEGPRFDASTADAPLFSSGYDGQYGSGAFNTGTITANGGKIRLIGQGPSSLAAVTGTLDVSAKAGIASLAGSISMTAETVRVGLYGAASGQLFANGPNQDETGAVVGGAIDLGDTARKEGDGDATKTRWVYVSGDVPGNTDIPGTKGSTLSANAADVGNGGTITLSAMYAGEPSADNVARRDYGQVEFYGNAEARGGKTGGAGGNVIIAGQQDNVELGDMRGRFNVTPYPSTTLPGLGLGANGSVSFVAPYMNIGYDPQGAYGGSFEHYEPVEGKSWISPDLITDLLVGGTNVSVTASGNGATAFARLTALHVYANSLIGSSGAGSSTLVLQSDGSLTIESGTSITASNGALDVQLEAKGGELFVGIPPDTSGEHVQISTNGGSLTLIGTQPTEGATSDSSAGVHISGAVFNTTSEAAPSAAGEPPSDKIIISGSGGGTVPGQFDTEIQKAISEGTPSKHGVIIDGGSQLTGTNISVTGVSDSATGVSINGTTLNSGVLGTSIYGQSRGGFAANGPAIGVDFGSGVKINMGSGDTTIKGRAVASELSPDAIGVRIGQLEMTSRPGQTAVQPLVTLIGVSVGSTAPGIQVTSPLIQQAALVAQQTPPQGISLHGEGTGLTSTADVIIGASASYPTAQMAMELGTPTWNTTGRINFKPMGLNDAMQTTDALATAIRVGANAGAVATNFIVKPEWFNAAVNGNIPSEPGPSFVIGSSGHTGLISVEDGALSGAGTVTLQNQGEGAAGIELGAQPGFMQNLNLVSEGNISQTGPIRVGALRVIPGATSTVALNNPANQITSVSVNNQPGNVAPDGVAAAVPLANAASAGIQSFDSAAGVFRPLSITVINKEVPREVPVTPPSPDKPVIPRPFEGPDALNDLRTDVYVHGQLSRPQICTAANTSGSAASTDGGAEPLALEWIKVRRSAQLSNCSGVRTDNSCSAF